MENLSLLNECNRDLIEAFDKYEGIESGGKGEKAAVKEIKKKVRTALEACIIFNFIQPEFAEEIIKLALELAETAMDYEMIKRAISVNTPTESDPMFVYYIEAKVKAGSPVS